MQDHETTIDFKQLRSQLDNQDVSLKEIRDALLGSFNKGGGLIENQRILRSDVDNILTLQRSNTLEINELKKSRDKLKGMFLLIGAAIPVFFELLKGVAVVAWDYFKGNK